MEFKKYKAHTRYKTKDGTLVPGVTTITGLAPKPALVPWANKIGLEGIEVGKYVDIYADMGTLVHYYIECYLKKQKADDSEYSQRIINIAQCAFLRVKKWIENKEYELVGSEMKLVSEKYGYGGTIDIFWYLKKVPTLSDIKTSKGIYDEQKMQVAAYRNLLIENGHKVDEVTILRVDKSENPEFESREVTKLDLHFKKFLLYLDIYRLNKEIGK